MKVVLLADIKDFGKKGEEREAKPGYVRNYLLPNNLVAISGTPEAEKVIAEQKIEEEKSLSESEKIEKVIAENHDLKINIEKKADGKKIFGSVKPEELIKLLNEKIGISAKSITPDKPIKNIGEFELTANFSGGANLQFSVIVEAKK